MGLGRPDAVVVVPPSNLLDPDNNDNLGRGRIGLFPVPPAANTLIVHLTLTASGTTAPRHLHDISDHGPFGRLG